MKRLGRGSIQNKLTFVIVCTSVVGLSLACISFDLYERSSFRKAMTTELSALAETLGTNAAAALTFYDRKSAEDILGALRAEKHIVGARLYDGEGIPFADYYRGGKGQQLQLPSSLQASGERFDKDSVILYRRVYLGGEKAGAIAIMSDLEAYRAKLRQYTEISVGVMFLSVLATYFVSSRLLRLITEPIMHLAQVATRVTHKEDYSLRAVSRRDDEVGTLIDSFNQMLERIQERDAALQHANEDLELRVQARTTELQLEVKERLHAEEALSNERKVLRALIDNIPDFMYVKDAECRFLVANLAVARQMGAQSPNELVGKTDFDYYPRDLATTFFPDWRK
jgi:PAS domain-containing protein